MLLRYIQQPETENNPPLPYRCRSNAPLHPSPSLVKQIRTVQKKGGSMDCCSPVTLVSWPFRSKGLRFETERSQVIQGKKSFSRHARFTLS